MGTPSICLSLSVFLYLHISLLPPAGPSKDAVPSSSSSCCRCCCRAGRAEHFAQTGHAVCPAGQSEAEWQECSTRQTRSAEQEPATHRIYPHRRPGGSIWHWNSITGAVVDHRNKLQCVSKKMHLPHPSAWLGLAQLVAVPHLKARWQQIIRTIPYARAGKLTKYKRFVTVLQVSVFFLSIYFS